MPFQRLKTKSVKTIALASGKAGVGKTSVLINLAVAMRKLDKDVMIVKTEPSSGLGVATAHDMQQLLTTSMTLKDIVVETLDGIKIVRAWPDPALDEFQCLKLIQAFDNYETEIDVLLVDTAAGISENVAFFCNASQEIIMVTSPDPASVEDTCSLIQVLCEQYREKALLVLVNMAKNHNEAFDVFKSLSKATEKFTNISLDYLGYLPFERSIQTPDCADYHGNEISVKSLEIAGKLLDRPEKIKGSLQFFIGKLLSHIV